MQIKMTKIFLALTAVILCMGTLQASQNTGTNVASSLRICYNTTELYDHDQRLPATINMLIDLIRSVEDSVPNYDARTLSVVLAHRFRQDGIQKSTTASSPVVLPFSPQGEEAYKNKILLDKLLPPVGVAFPENALSLKEQCGLHFMTSNTVELQVRGDETSVCKRSGQYTMQRSPRAVDIKDEDREALAETADLVEDNVERVPVSPKGLPRAFGSNNDEISDCPVENGVVYTRWGALHPGTVIAGIAAGYETQDFISGDIQLDSKYAVTVAGDLVEVAFLEAATTSKYTIGAKGGFNSTLAPHWYFKDGKSRVFLTDPELRADLDGLIIASNIRTWSQKYSNMKLSQILDAYYSNRGVFSSDIKACNRNKYVSEYAPSEVLVEQTRAFAELYNNLTTFGSSPSSEDIQKLSENVVKAYNAAISSIADSPCEENYDRIVTDFIIAVDTTWSFDYIHRTVSYVLDNLDINKYESNYTVINAKDGSVIVESTWSLSKFADNFNRSYYDKSEKGFDGSRLMTAIERQHELRAKLHQDKNNLNGKSSTVLLMPKSTDSSQGSYINSRFSSVMDNYYPGTLHIVLGSGSRDVYNSFVRNPSTDIFIVPEYINNNEDTVKTTLNSLVTRLREAPRKIINPKCGSSMSGGSSSDTKELYIEPGTMNVYKVASAFTSGEGMKTLKFRPTSGGNVTICTSTGDAKPELTCETLGSGERTFDLTGGSDFNFILTAGHTTANSNVRCTDKNCRFPDTVKVTVQIDGFSCSDNNAGVRITSPMTAFITLLVAYFINKFY